MKKANARARGLRAPLTSTRAHRARDANGLGGRHTPRRPVGHSRDAIGVLRPPARRTAPQEGAIFLCGIA